MDACHARDQYNTDHTGHGKNYLGGKCTGYTGNDRSV